jgi:hypothetical protein
MSRMATSGRTAAVPTVNITRFFTSGQDTDIFQDFQRRLMDCFNLRHSKKFSKLHAHEPSELGALKQRNH